MLKFDANGLIPAIVQDANTRQVLMLGYMNAEALRRTVASGQAWFWSRSRGALWHKGETSGNYLNVRAVRVDCDGDTLLVEADPAGPTCHTGAVSCFFEALPAELEGDLAEAPPTPAARNGEAAAPTALDGRAVDALFADRARGAQLLRPQADAQFLDLAVDLADVGAAGTRGGQRSQQLVVCVFDGVHPVHPFAVGGGRVRQPIQPPADRQQIAAQIAQMSRARGGDEAAR